MSYIGCVNTDKEIWRETPGDYYSNSIHATEDGNIGINVGGIVFVATIEDWHRAGHSIVREKELLSEVGE